MELNLTRKCVFQLALIACFCFALVTSASEDESSEQDDCVLECMCHDVDAKTAGLTGPEDKKVKSAVCIVNASANFSDIFSSLGKSKIQFLSIMQTGSQPENSTIKLQREHFTFMEDLESLEIIAPVTTNIEQDHKDGLVIEFDALTPLAKIERIFLIGVKLMPNQNLIAWNEKDDFRHEEESKKKHVDLKEEAGEVNQTEITIEVLKSKLKVQEKLPTILPYDEYKKYVETHGKFTSFRNLTTLKSLKLVDVFISHPNWEMLENVPNLQELTMEKCGIKFLSPKFFSGAPGLTRLALNDNEILGLDFQMFLGLPNIKYLDLSSNKIDHLSLLSFPYLPSLEELKITNNPITQVFPAAFRSVENVTSIQIGSEETQVRFKSRAFRGLEHLENLQIRNMVGESIDVETFETCRSLKDVRITGDVKMIDYDAFTASAGTMETLTLQKAGIRNLSMDAFFGLDKLKKLDLSWNELDRVPHGTFDPLVNLKELDLRANKLADLPITAFESLLRIDSIKLSENPWHCSCHMSTWKRRVVTKGNANAPLCHSPEEVRGVPVFKALKNLQLNCTESEALALARNRLKLKALPSYGKV